MAWHPGCVPHNAGHIDRRYKDPEWLRDQYVTHGLTTQDIADEVGCDRHTIARWLKESGIKVRTGQESHKAKGYIARMSGANHPSFKHGKTCLVSGWGYKRIPLYGEDRDNHRCDNQGRVSVHIYVMECALGRPLTKGEVVHHKNFDRLDNRVENLMIFPSQRDHSRYHKHLERLGALHLGILTEVPMYVFPDGFIDGADLINVIGTQS